MRIRGSFTVEFAEHCVANRVGLEVVHESMREQHDGIRR